jgi:hypothetical protein
MKGLVAVDPNRDYRTEILDEIPRTYYPGRGFLTDQEAYPVPTQGNQGNNQGGFNFGRALGAMAGYLGMGFGDPAFSPGLKLTPELAGRYGGIRDLLYRPNQDKAEVQLLAGSFNMPIDPNAHRQNTKTQKIYNKGMRTDNPYEKEMFLKRTGVQLPRV